MKTISIFFVLILVSYSSAAKISESSTFNRKCAKRGYACGQCEDTLQSDFTGLLNNFLQQPEKTRHWSQAHTRDRLKVKAGTSPEDFISQAASLMRKHNKIGDGRLNFITVGESQSLHETSPGNPRILMKSPNGELWVSFNTDPKSSAYSKIEIMRWSGRDAKWKFQELDFSPKARHANFSGSNCIVCHKTDARPIWDTYRAWPGILPPRDDMVERDQRGKGPDANGRAYISFLERIAKAKQNPKGADRRLASLEIPALKRGSPREQIDSIKTEVASQGWSRVRHFPPPDSGLLGNTDSKTAKFAGPAHLTFDQLQSIQACHIAHGLEALPIWPNLKYVVAGVMYCASENSINPKFIRQFFNHDFASGIDHYFEKAGNHNGPNNETLKKPTANFGSLTKALPMLYKSTRRYQVEEANDKILLQETYLKGYLTRVEKMPAAKAAATARYLARDKKIETIPGFIVIADPGGVKGVAESSTARIAALRYALEPFGVEVGSWALSRGNGVAGGKSFSFSDQFEAQFGPQRAIRQVFDSVKGRTQNEKCEELMKLSRAKTSGRFGELTNASKEHLKRQSAGVSRAK